MKKLFVFRLYLLPILSRIGTRAFQRFVVRLLPLKVIQESVEIVDILHNTSLDIIKSRKMALEGGKEAMGKQVGRGKDIMSILREIPVLLVFYCIHWSHNSAGQRTGWGSWQTLRRGSCCTNIVSSLCSYGHPEATQIRHGCSTFTFAATDTTSSALARILWVLAQRQDAQDKLRLEICEARKVGDDLAYDELMNLRYLDAVCRETLRL